MVSQSNPANELYNLRWNSYFSNLINVFTEHQNQESLVDVTIGCEGQFIKAHKLVLSACSVYFQRIFQTHTSPQLLILLNDVKFDYLRLVVQFMYKGEVKVADTDLQSFLQLGKMLQVKGLSSVELQDKQKLETETKLVSKEAVPPEKKSSESGKSPDKKSSEKLPEKKLFEAGKLPEKKVPEKMVSEDPKPEAKKSNLVKIALAEPPNVDKNDIPPVKKRKLPSPTPEESTKTPIPDSSSEKDIPRIPRPPNAFMIFANQWRKKLAVEYPTESNKDISVRLGKMWKSLSPETKDAFYDDAQKADEEHKVKYPGYYYNPREARQKKVIARVTREGNRFYPARDIESDDDTEYIEIKCEEGMESDPQSTPKSNGSN